MAANVRMRDGVIAELKLNCRARTCRRFAVATFAMIRLSTLKP
jgi:hypothetical protein